jgi:[glutamine synthetase] adenylyltransferase / [glutamine synthetase]-adenylyl-L-tyrosine phosphorylase
MSDYTTLLQQSPDPETAAIRLDQLLQDATARRYLAKMPSGSMPTFIHLISISNFLFRYFCRHPGVIVSLYGPNAMERDKFDGISDSSTLRTFKYQELLKITWMDLAEKFSYPVILDRLSHLADNVIIKAMHLAAAGKQYPGCENSKIPFCIFAMGKLGAKELNYSSDIDLIFVAKNYSEFNSGALDYLGGVIDHVRRFNALMQDVSEDGFLYRVDLKLRPWGRSGPLVTSIDETEHYYEASTEAWERFAWLRARILSGGDWKLGEDLMDRLDPFIYLRSLGSDDLERFIRIKNDMARQRWRNENWNVKLGEGGIRDIEFFIQILQIVNAHTHPALKSTNTLVVLDNLVKLGFVSREDGSDINDSYLFLRRLENRLQMVDEQQTHLLPDDFRLRRKIACSLGFGGSSDEQTVERFDRQLEKHRQVAKSCFKRILPKES